MCLEFFLAFFYFLIIILINLFLGKFLIISVFDIKFLQVFLKSELKKKLSN
jgi:hypothetical protein